jgi:ABC-type nitrate/sulfonate/bicarbonate transport system permease component
MKELSTSPQPPLEVLTEAGAIGGRRSWRLGRRADWWLPAISVIVFLAIWQLVGSRMNPILLSTPLAVAEGLWTLLTHGTLLQGFLASLADLGVGFGLAIVVGIGAGILMGRYHTVERVLDPYVAFMNATPMVALVPAVIIWFGVGFQARVFFVFILAIWSVLVNTVAGIKNVNRGLSEVGIAFGLSEFQMVRWVSVPAAVPYILAGIRVGLGKAIVGMIIGEMDMQLAGLGGLVANFGDAFQTANLFAVIVCTSIFGVLFVGLLNVVQKRWFGWISETAGGRR